MTVLRRATWSGLSRNSKWAPSSPRNRIPELQLEEHLVNPGGNGTMVGQSVSRDDPGALALASPAEGLLRHYDGASVEVRAAVAARVAHEERFEVCQSRVANTMRSRTAPSPWISRKR